MISSHEMCHRRLKRSGWIRMKNGKATSYHVGYKTADERNEDRLFGNALTNNVVRQSNKLLKKKKKRSFHFRSSAHESSAAG